jgi:phosphoglycerate dehydrogenase-like enzyme
MTRMRILSQVRPALTSQLGEKLPEVEIISIPARGDLPPEVAGEVLLTYPWAGPNLSQVLERGVRWIHLLGTGADAFPLHLLGDQVLTCSRGGSAVPIAEWVLAVILAFEKRLPEAWIHELPTDWGRRSMRGTLSGKTLGLVGFGAIGSAVARRALPFDMRVRACRRSASPASLPGVEIAGELTDLVASADHIVIAAPATPATRHLFDRELFARMKPGVHLVNIARGALVDQDALREALDGPVAMASLDAVEPEPLPAGHWMYTHPRVRLSPHLSWQMPDAADVLIQCFIENLRAYQSGAPLSGIVDRVERY